MANFISDDIDFDAYMDLTEHDHRVIPAGEYAEEVRAYFWDEARERGAVLPWQKAVGKVAFRPAEVTLWGGYNGHGKSLALGQFVVSLMAQKKRCCIASFEMKPVITLARMCRQASGANKPDPEFIERFHRYTDSWIWIYDQQGMITADRIAAVMNYCAKVKKIDHFVLDSLTKCGIAEDDYTRQKLFVDQICTIARDTGMHIHVVAHSRKQRDETVPPGKMDVRGAGSITDQVDNVLTWWRNKAKEEAIRSSKAYEPMDPDAVMICDKQRNGEWEGRLGFWFEPASLQFIENQGGVTMSMSKVPSC